MEVYIILCHTHNANLLYANVIFTEALATGICLTNHFFILLCRRIDSCCAMIQQKSRAVKFSILWRTMGAKHRVVPHTENLEVDHQSLYTQLTQLVSVFTQACSVEVEREGWSTVE